MDLDPPEGGERPSTGTERLDMTPMPGHVPMPANADPQSTDVSFSFLLPPVADDEIGRLGNYRVLRLLGRGGMGFVFLAEDIALKRQTALKVMTPSQAGRSDGWPRFLREARILASIKHPNIVTVYQAGQERDVAFIAMELLAGETLLAWQRRQKEARPEDIVRIGRGIAAGLAAVHTHGLVHRDIKPANVWLESPSGTVKLLDFGLARGVADAEFTRAGTVLGTPAFMSPEQARGEKIDGRSDLFSLGSVLYGLCTGQAPFPGSNTLATLTALAVAKVRPAREVNPAIPKRLSQLIDRLLAKEADDRPDTAEEVVAELDRIAAGEPSTVVKRDGKEPAIVVTSPARPKRKKRRPAPEKKVPWLAIGSSVLAAGFLIGVIVAVVAGRRPAATPAGNEVVTQTHLADLTPFEEEGWLRRPPPPPSRGQFPPAQPPGEFELRVGGKRLSHSLFMHPQPRPGPTVARGSFRLDRKFAQFRTGVALHDDNGGRTEVPVTFAVIGDGKLLWLSRNVHLPGDADECVVDVKGVSVLTLEVRCPGPPKAAHAVWVEPRLDE